MYCELFYGHVNPFFECRYSRGWRYIDNEAPEWFNPTLKVGIANVRYLCKVFETQAWKVGMRMVDDKIKDFDRRPETYTLSSNYINARVILTREQKRKLRKTRDLNKLIYQDMTVRCNKLDEEKRRNKPKDDELPVLPMPDDSPQTIVEQSNKINQKLNWDLDSTLSDELEPSKLEQVNEESSEVKEYKYVGRMEAYPIPSNGGSYDPKATELSPQLGTKPSPCQKSNKTTPINTENQKGELLSVTETQSTDSSSELETMKSGSGDTLAYQATSESDQSNPTKRGPVESSPKEKARKDEQSTDRNGRSSSDSLPPSFGYSIEPFHTTTSSSNASSNIKRIIHDIGDFSFSSSPSL